MIKLVACRLEGMLSTPQMPLNLRSLQKRLTEMKNHQTQMVLVSSRSYPYLLTKFQSVTGPLDYVAENGAEMVVNGVNIKERMLDPVLLSRILDWLNQESAFKDAKITLSSKANTITNAAKQSDIYPTLRKFYPTVKAVPDLLMVASHIYQIRIDFPRGNVALRKDLIKEHFNRQIRIVDGGPRCFYIVRPEAKLADGLATIQKHLGVRIRQTAAFGNCDRDADYLNEAKYSFVTPDASSNLKDNSQLLKDDHQSTIIKKIDQLMKQK